MTSVSGFKCEHCKGHHEKKAFISHAGKDKDVADKVSRACCEVGVAAYLYELTDEFHSQLPPGEVLAKSIAESDILCVLLSKSVSKTYWTQAWIGFEVGISKGLAIGDKTQKSVIVVQDIHQGIGACVPLLDAHFLFDFSSEHGWDQYSGLVLVLAKLGNSGTFFQTANRFRTATMKANVKCGNCKGEYEAWIAKDDAQELGKGFNVIPEGPELKAECTIDCPSCDAMVTRVFVQMLPS